MPSRTRWPKQLPPARFSADSQIRGRQLAALVNAAVQHGPQHIQAEALGLRQSAMVCLPML
jgi:hypothetical protein